MKTAATIYGRPGGKGGACLTAGGAWGGDLNRRWSEFDVQPGFKTELLDRVPLRSILICLALATAALPTAVAAKDLGTVQVGGGGGSNFTDRCEPGEVLMGFDYNAGKALDSLQAICAAVTPQRAVGRALRQLKRRGGKGAGEFYDGSYVYCRANSAVTTVRVKVDKFGAVRKLKLRCNLVSDRSFAGQFSTGNSGGETSYADDASCPDSHPFAVGITGGAGALIDRIGLICEDVVARFEPKPRPVPPKPQQEPGPPAMKIDRQAGDGKD